MFRTPDLSSRGSVHVVHRAADLPEAWDRLCESLLQRRALLRHYEATNPCGQRYYCHFERGRLVAGAVVYSIVQNLLTFLGNVPSPVKLNIIGLPASIPPAGIIGDARATRELLAAIFATETGFVLALNQRPTCEVEGPISLRMLPDMIFKNRFASLAEYRDSLRSSWRRRMSRSQRRFHDVVVRRSDCTAFTPAHYDLYRQVVGRASARLETLQPDFFRGLPRPLELVSCYHGGALLCWRVELVEDDRLVFVLGGHHYGMNSRFDGYFNNLLGVLADGMAHGVDEIDLGQTAEDAKARVGAEPVETRMLLAHSNAAVSRLLRMAAPLIAYRPSPPVYHVFRDGAVPA